MAYRFEYHGGVAKPSVHTLEKFLAFFVVGGREIPFHLMQRDNLVVKLKEKADEYQTSHNVLKLFVMQTGFGLPKRWYSFYFKLVNTPAAEVTIRPFPKEGARVTASEFYLRGTFKFLSTQQVEAMLNDDSESKRFVSRQSPLPLDTLRAMVTVDKSFMKKGVRTIRIESRESAK